MHTFHSKSKPSHKLYGTTVPVVSIVPFTAFGIGLVVVMVGAGAGVAKTDRGVGKNVVPETQGPSPSQPCFRQDVVKITAVVLVVGESVVVSRQPPNQPYATHDVFGPSVVVIVEDVVVEVALLVVVSSSRQPHHPGVLHVVVRVGLAVEELLLLVVVGSELLLSKYFQLKQSTHSSSGTHGGTLSYTSRTSWTTERIRW